MVSATDEKKVCGHQYPPLCEDSIGTDIISPTRSLGAILIILMFLAASSTHLRKMTSQVLDRDLMI